MKNGVMGIMPVNSLKGEIQALELADVESIETGKSFIRN